MPDTRPRPAYAALLLCTVGLGLATRRVPEVFPPVVAEYGGDTLWAAMVFWLLALWRVRVSTAQLAATAMGICTVVELSQLYQASWAISLRGKPGVGLILGQGFLWSDLVCYAVGVAVAAVLDALLHALLQARSPSSATRA